ncbi:MAG: metallophosphoesterase [Planctomycetes bacterium]|nr:metallophosphoesterase [Planctomycetota bacterium]
MPPRRPRWLRRISRTLPGRALGLSTLASGWTAQPWRVGVTEVALPAPAAAPGLAGRSAVLVTDLHLRHPAKGVGPKLRRILRDLAPDLVLVGGDTHDRPSLTWAAVEHIGEYRAPLGVFVVPGNHEHRWGVDMGRFRADLAARGATLLLNEHRMVGEGGAGGPGKGAGGLRFAVAGTDDPVTGRHDLDAALRGIEAGTYVVLLSHAGVVFEEAEARGVPLLLCGHSHGGQVRLPVVGAPVMPRRVGPCVRGVHGRNGTTMIVSAGAGTSILPVRYDCPPEVVRIRWGRG